MTVANHSDECRGDPRSDAIDVEFETNASRAALRGDRSADGAASPDFDGKVDPGHEPVDVDPEPSSPADSGSGTAPTEEKPPSKKTILPEHQAQLDASCISADVAAERGYWSARQKAEIERLGFGESQCRAPALVIPIYNVRGELCSYQIRPNDPRMRDGKLVKYETPHKSQMVVDVPPRCRPMLGDPKIPLIITEGIKKGDSAASRGLCCVSLLGVWNFRGTNDDGGKTLLADWEAIAFNDRNVYIAFDSDAMDKVSVYKALSRLADVAKSRGGNVYFIYLPPGEHGKKVGLDDYFAQGHSDTEFFDLATRELRRLRTDIEGRRAGPYIETELGISLEKSSENSSNIVPLTNFKAVIRTQTHKDDGVEVQKFFEIHVELHGREFDFEVTAGEFSSMSWVLCELGAMAIVLPGQTTRDHARTAIQMLSGEIPRREIFTHLGWRKIGSTWNYLHAGGAIGPNGTIGTISVEIGADLANYSLPAPQSGGELTVAIRIDLELLDGLAPDREMMPLFCAVTRSVIETCDFAIHLSGESGRLKSERAALCQQHFGAAMDARNFPANWSNTANSNETLAFHAKDAILVVDDFAPNGSTADVARYHRDADRLFRAQGNNSGRRRSNQDGSLRPCKPPRGMILSTGEDVPRGGSARGRVMIIGVARDVVNLAKLTKCQTAAAAGTYAGVTAAFIQWIAPRRDEVIARKKEFVQAFRNHLDRVGHARTPSMVAELLAGFDLYLSFAFENGAIRKDEAEALHHRALKALIEAATDQSSHQDDADPVQVFLRLVRATLSSGRGHLRSTLGDAPPAAADALGWTETKDGVFPRGKTIGWIANDDIYLEPEAAFAEAQGLATEQGETIPVGKKTIWKRMDDRGLLASTEEERGRNTVRVTIGNSRRTVLHVKASLILQEIGPIGPISPSPSLTTSPPSVAAMPSPFFWADSKIGATSGSTKSAQSTVADPVEPDLGRLGRFQVREEPLDKATPPADADDWGSV